MKYGNVVNSWICTTGYIMIPCGLSICLTKGKKGWLVPYFLTVHCVNMGRVRASYTSKFKLQVVRYAVEHENRAAGRKFDVDEKMCNGGLKYKMLSKTHLKIINRSVERKQNIQNWKENSWNMSIIHGQMDFLYTSKW